MSESLVPLARAWNSWDANHPAEMTYLPLGLRVGLCLNAFRQCDQPVGLTRHGREYDHHLVAEHFEFGDAFRYGADAFDVGDRGAAVFLYYECHVRARG